MKILFDFKKLNPILKSFYDITGLRYSTVDPDYNVVCASSGASDFCARINAIPEGHMRCINSDTQAAKSVTKDTKMRIYRCHAGVTEVIIPLVDEDEIIAYLFFGQILASEESIDRQWLRAKANLEWYKDQDSLEILFKKLNILDYQKIKACAVILKACSAYIWLDGMVKKASLSDIQRVNAYIETNYTKDITLDSMVDALAMSKTKLCSLAKNQDTTIMKMVRNKRIKSAKRFLEKTEYPISEIAEMVGINDYNYFAKVFKAVERITPRDYRKQIKKEHDYSV